MTEQQAPAWEAPEQPRAQRRVACAPHGPRLLSYLIDVLIVGAVVITAIGPGDPGGGHRMAPAHPEETLSAPQWIW